MDRCIRRMNADERVAELYDEIYAQVVAEQEAEYEAEFGAEYRARHPFKPSHNTHQQVMNRIAQMGR